MKQSTLPHFIIVGTQKSGTTALADMLGQHPRIYVPRGEANFFDKRFDRGLKYYESFLSPGVRDEPLTRLIVGEKTPGYAISHQAPTRMFDTAPDAKLIWIFRDPVKRACSHYWFSIQNGQDKLSFEDAVNEEGERGNKRLAWTYLRRGYYAEQIRRFLEYFP